MPQYARPSEDTLFSIPAVEAENQDSWHAHDGGLLALFPNIADIPTDDGNYAESDLIDDSSDIYVTKLSPVEDPEAELSEGLTVSIRLAKDAVGRQVDAVVELREGYVSESELGTLVKVDTFENLAETFATYTFAITPDERAFIYEPNNLYLRIQFISP